MAARVCSYGLMQTRESLGEFESLCGLHKYFQIQPNSLKCLLQAI